MPTRTNVIPDAQITFFRNIRFHGIVTAIVDSHKSRLAVKEYLKRDGAEIEYMGRGPKRFRMTLVFLGENFRRRYAAFMSHMDRDPKGLLVHPLLGSIQCAYEGAEGQIDLARAVNCIEVPVSFIEDRVDTNLQEEFEQQQSVSTKEAGILERASAFRSLAARFTSAATNVELAAGYAEAYGAAAATAARTSTPDTSLDTRLRDVADGVLAATADILADDVATSNALAFPALNAAEQMYAACLEMDIAIGSAKPPLIEYVVAGTTSIVALAAKIYGKDAMARMEEMLTLNRISSPHAIPAGTVLRLYQAPATSTDLIEL